MHQQQQQSSPSPRHGAGSSPLPPCPGVDRTESYPRRAPSNTRTSGTSTPRGGSTSFPRVPSCSASEYASCDEQLPSHHHQHGAFPAPMGSSPGAGSHIGGLGSVGSGSFDLPMPPSPASREAQNSSGEGRRSKQIFVQRTTYHTTAGGDKRKESMTFSYVSSESDSSRPGSNSQNQRKSKSQGNRPPKGPKAGNSGADDPFSWFASQEALSKGDDTSRPSTYSEGTSVGSKKGGAKSGGGGSGSSRAPSSSKLPAGMEVIYNRDEDTDSDFSFCDVAEQEPDRPSTAVLVQQQQQQQQLQLQQQGLQTASHQVPSLAGTSAMTAGGGSGTAHLPPMSGRGSGRKSGGDGGMDVLTGSTGSSGRNPNAPSFATRYRGTVKSYSKQNESSVGNNTSNNTSAFSGASGQSPRKQSSDSTTVGGIKSLKKRVTSSRPDLKPVANSSTSSGVVRRKPTTTVKSKVGSTSNTSPNPIPNVKDKAKLARQHLFDDEEDSSDAFGSSSSFDSSDDDASGYATPMEHEGMAQ